MGFRDSVRARIERVAATGVAAMVISEEREDVGVMPSGVGRRLAWSFDGIRDGEVEFVLVVITEVEGWLNAGLEAGVEGVWRATRRGRKDRGGGFFGGVGLTKTGCSSVGESGELMEEEEVSRSLELLCRML